MDKIRFILTGGNVQRMSFFCHFIAEEALANDERK